MMIPIGPSRAPRGMSRPVSSCSRSGIRSLLVSSLGRVASRMSPVVCFEVFGVHTVLYLTGQIIPFFTNMCTEEVFPQFKPGGRDLDTWMNTRSEMRFFRIRDSKPIFLRA